MIKSIFGGVSIALASYIYLNINNQILGAFLFSIGLLLILNMQFNLYTGKVGYIKSKQDIKITILILIGNIIGCCLLFLLPQSETSISLIENKLMSPLPLVFVKSIICGFFIYCAVECYKNKSVYMVIFCVMGFILSGSEHSIADISYFIAARTIDKDIIIYILIIIVGNAIGSLLTNYGIKFDKK